jgi:hypothetical protein
MDGRIHEKLITLKHIIILRVILDHQLRQGLLLCGQGGSLSVDFPFIAINICGRTKTGK